MEFLCCPLVYVYICTNYQVCLAVHHQQLLVSVYTALYKNVRNCKGILVLERRERETREGMEREGSRELHKDNLYSEISH